MAGKQQVPSSNFFRNRVLPIVLVVGWVCIISFSSFALIAELNQDLSLSARGFSRQVLSLVAFKPVESKTISPFPTKHIPTVTRTFTPRPTINLPEPLPQKQTHTPTRTPTVTRTIPPTPISMPSSTATFTLTLTPSTTPTLTPTPTITPTVVEPGIILCENLTSLQLPDTILTMSEIVWPGWISPPSGDQGNVVVDRIFCRVAGIIAPSINFEVWMPLTTGQYVWNRRFNGVGNSGIAGSIRYADMLAALGKGYATASTDTGHQGKPADGQWMRDHPELIPDFSYRAIHMMTVDAKAIIQAYYGQASQYSYFTGCSGGGQQGMMEAQRFPEDYDGIVAGAPANYRTHSWPGEFWPAFVTHRSEANTIPQAKLPLIHQAALAACDANDGINDNLISNPLTCNFNPAVLLCPGVDSPDCLTAGEIDSLVKIYSSVYDPTSGEQFWPGLEPGSELGWMGWGSLLPDPWVLSLAYFKYMIFPEYPDWQWQSFDFTDAQDFALLTDADAYYGPILNADNPNLSAFESLGGKLIIYHGWADQQIAPRNSINYYNSVVSFMGNESTTQEFLRLFLVPGMMHCGRGTGPRIFNTLAAMRMWVEQGIAPAAMASADQTRLLCPYPQSARYKGIGDVNNPNNYECVNP